MLYSLSQTKDKKKRKSHCSSHDVLLFINTMLGLLPKAHISLQFSEGIQKFFCSDRSCFLLYFLKARHSDKEYPTEIPPLDAHSQAQNAPQAIRSTGLGILHCHHY